MKKLTIILLLVLLCGGATCFLVGCPAPPTGTVEIDIDGDGSADALARDADGDGKPDLDADGNPEIVKGSGIYKYTSAADSIVPLFLGILSTFGIPAVGVLGAIWARVKPGRVAANTYMSVQAVRAKFAEDPTMTGALEIMDTVLNDVQTAETVNAIKKVKDNLGLHLTDEK